MNITKIYFGYIHSCNKLKFTGYDWTLNTNNFHSIFVVWSNISESIGEMRFEDLHSLPAINLMCHSFFGKHLNASPLPLFEAAPDFPSVGRRADRQTDDSPPAEKNHHVKKKYIKRDTQSKFVRVRTYSCHHHHRVRVLNGSAESEWTERERSRTVSPTVRAHRPSDRLHCVCLSTVGGDWRCTRWNFEWRFFFFLVKRRLIFLVS